MNKRTVLLDHGSGGKLSNSMVSEIILPLFDNPTLSCLGDGAVLDIGDVRIAMSTDSFVVDPIFFPGGSIGDLAVNGTVNDVSMCGAKPLYLSVGLILEEGFPISDMERVLNDMSGAAKRAGVEVVTGDTKVVPAGAVDKVFINTTGIGVLHPGVNPGADKARPGDKIILSGTIADHGMTILTQREGLEFDSGLRSDSAPLNHMVQGMLEVSSNIHVLRDPTRGGVATSLNEIAKQSNVGIRIYEDRIPVTREVAGVCELLGFDPLYVANEGKLISFVDEEDTEKVLEAIKKDQYGREATVIGEVVSENSGRVLMKTHIGGERIVSMLTGEQLPRIC